MWQKFISILKNINFKKEKPMKKIIVYSHKNDLGEKSIKCQNGEIYDSSIEVILNNSVIYRTDKVHVCASPYYTHNNYQVEICSGNYFGFIGRHGIKFDDKGKLIENGYKAIYICNEKLQEYKNLKWMDFFTKEGMEEIQTLNSMYPNPNWGNKNICKYIHVHKGGDNFSWSAGCIVIHYSDFEKFISNFEENEIILIEKIG